MTSEGHRSLARRIRAARPKRQHGRGLRAVLYSHDAMGLGHVRRNLMIAQRLVEADRIDSAMLLCGASEAARFPTPERIDFVVLPSFRKKSGSYEPRSLSLSTGELKRLRSRSIEAALEGFEPDLLIVDKWPLGLLGELAPPLEKLARGGRTRCVLGLRDVLDEPRRVAREWDARARKAIEESYDTIWVYGDRRVYDVISECGLDAFESKVRYTGYLDRHQLAQPSADDLGLDPVPEEPFVLCTLGGGEDGERLATAFARASFPAGCSGVLLTGPFLSPAARRRVGRVALGNPDLRIIGFTRDPSALFERARRVVAMGGYNTVCELVSARQRALVVPRREPRCEQWIRAERFSRLGLLDVCPPEEVTPKALEEWFARDVPRPEVDGRLDLGGLARLPVLFDDTIAGVREDVSGMA